MNRFCEKHKKIARDKYHKKYFETYKDCSKKQWSMINSLLNRKSKSTSSYKLKDPNNNLITAEEGVANTFNNYFSGIAANMKEQISPRMTFDPGGFQNYLHDPCQNSILLRPTNQFEVHKVIKDFKNKSTLDTKVEVLKLANTSFTFTNTLAKIINSSFQQGIFPDALKLARVVPVHKEGAKNDVTNYRPISLLSVFSKIYEKIMHNRVLDFLNENNLLFEMQYGFRPGRSCEHALLQAQNHIIDTLNKKQVALLLLIDFSKAFDIVEHPVLLYKLNHLGIRGIALKWFESYLSNRKQFVRINNADSVVKEMSYGVPQGSILGPLLFVIYINDLPSISEVAKFILYADDANIIVTGSSIHEAMNKINILSQDLVKWVNLNGLALNLKKTKYMVFTRQRIDLNETELSINKHTIERKSECRFLGVIMDEKLKWTAHITAVRTKMTRYLGVMFKIKSRLPIKVRIQIFHSFVQSHLNFCSLVWGFAAKSLIQSLFIKQKQGVRAIMPGYVNYWYKEGKLPAHTKEKFKEYEILTVHGIIAMNALIFMHKWHHFPKLLPPSVHNLIPHTIPKFGDGISECSVWAEKYNTVPYRPTFFYKGPLFAVTKESAEVISPATILSIKLYRSYTKQMLIEQQTSGSDSEWPEFLLHKIPGLRKSARIIANKNLK